MEQGDKVTPETNGDNPTGTSKMFNVKVWTDANWEAIMQEVEESELLAGYQRQQDYTKKTQELAEQRKELAKSPSSAKDNETEEIKQTLSSLGFTTKEDLTAYIESVNKGKEEEKKLDNLIQTNPDLKKYAGAIKEIAKTDKSAIEDIVVKYGFSTHDKLKEAKESRWLVGDSNITKWWQKSVKDMTDKEFAEFKAKIQKKWDFR